ncbi:MAG TPA: DinB family protein [Acidimicrobiia bacterium]|jgi:uncharacterized damage-inducible protein DinB|nr:DinB family protein [Acidimicrobiia bacterium]
MDLTLELLRPNTMMNERLVEVCRHLTDDQVAATVDGTYGGIGATLVHIANGRIGYVPRLVLDEKPDHLSEDPFPGFEIVAERLGRGNALLEETTARASELPEIQVSGDDPPGTGTWRMPASLILLQAVNHATEHRSQIATILTQLGIEPPAMDGWTFFFDAGHMIQV